MGIESVELEYFNETLESPYFLLPLYYPFYTNDKPLAGAWLAPGSITGSPVMGVPAWARAGTHAAPHGKAPWQQPYVAANMLRIHF